MQIISGTMAPAAPVTADEFSGLMARWEVDIATSGTGVAVAVSGGADSLALTVMLGQWCRSRNISLMALTVDHDLRPESAAESRQVQAWLADYNISHVTLKWCGDKPRSNIQHQARLARYRLMGQWCQQNNLCRLFLGHHQGDQAETFLIRLFRGSGVDGLSAMKPRSDYPLALLEGAGVDLFRPLLAIDRSRLEATLQQAGQSWIEDPGNHNQLYTRVRIRKLLQDNNIEGLNVARMAQTASRMARVQSLLHVLTTELTGAAVAVYPEGYAEVNVEILLAAHEEIALRCLAALTRRVSGGRYVPRLVKLESLYNRLKAPDFAGQTLAGCLITPGQGAGVIFSREVAAIDDSCDLAPHAQILWDGRFIIKNGSIAGRITPLGQSEWQQACRQYPDLDKLAMVKFIRESLPCILSAGGKIILADFMPGCKETGFRASFQQ